MWMEYNVSPHLINLSLHLGKIQSPARVLFLTVFKIVCARKTAVGSVRSVHSWNGCCNTEWHFIFLAWKWHLVILSYHIAPCNGRQNSDDKIPATNSEVYSLHLFLGIQVAISSHTITRGNNTTEKQFSGGTSAACQAWAVRKTQFVGIQIIDKLDNLNIAQKAKKKKETTYFNNQRKVIAREACRKVNIDELTIFSLSSATKRKCK